MDDKFRRECEHDWQPISFVFETQWLDERGSPKIRQPDLEKGRVYCVCMKCHSHTYMETKWIGFFLYHEVESEDYKHPRVRGN